MGLAGACLQGAVRFSLGSGNTPAEVETVLQMLPPIVTRLRQHASGSIRRTAATLMQELGVMPFVIEAVLNHAEPNRMKRIYQKHKYRAEMRDAWLRLGAYLESLHAK